MVKMLSPNFPPRRPSGYARIVLVVIVLLLLFFTWGNRTPARGPPGTAFTRPMPGSEGVPADRDHGAAPHTEKPHAPSDPQDASSPFVRPQLDTKPKRPTEPESASRPKTKPKSRPDSSAPHKSGGKAGLPPAVKEKADKAKAQSPLDAEEDSKKTKSVPETQETNTRPISSTATASATHAETKPDIPLGAASSGGSMTSGPEDGHPIDKLIYDAQHNFAELLSKESKSIEEAAQAYRKRRGRHPPPGFDLWYEFARNNSALLVEDFFDQIYHDLQPFWGMDPAVLRKESWDFEMTIHIRGGIATAESDWFWTQIWLNLIKTIEHLLPDMDLALNPMDEPRLVVPWEDVQGYMDKAAKTVKLPKAKNVVSEFQPLPEPGQGDLDIETRPKKFEDTRPYWNIARRGCAPDSAARTADLQTSFARAPDIDASNADPHSHKGYVSNFTMSTELCHQPDLQGLEGILIEPLSVSATKVMFPMFGGSKLSVNNEILLPAPMYWNEEERFTGGDDHGIAWSEKTNNVIWRGVATGGKNTPYNWRGFQRHRFVAMNNGTAVGRAESGESPPENFVLADSQYNLGAQQAGKTGEWIDEWADVSFIDLMCDPVMEDGSCPYTDEYFTRNLGLKMSEQFDSKYLPDIDGNSFSGRYLGFLRSTSLPIKATLWREWHDSRLVPWKHFVPMDSRFGDYYGIMEYFLGYEGRNGHDQAAEKIASEGKEWAEQVLRKEDMQIYVLRLLLEYARILDDGREDMGWVADVLKDPSLEKSWLNWW